MQFQVNQLRFRRPRMSNKVYDSQCIVCSISVTFMLPVLYVWRRHQLFMMRCSQSTTSAYVYRPCPVPRLPLSRRKKYMCPLDPSRPLSQRKVYVKICEMCQNTAQLMLNFFFSGRNGESTQLLFSSVESPITTNFFCPLCPPPCPVAASYNSKILVPPMMQANSRILALFMSLVIHY